MLAFVLIIFLVNLVFNNGHLTSNNFPLQPRWSTDLGSSVEALSTNDAHVLFARTRNSLFAIDMQTGKILWKHSLTWQAIPKPPIASNGMVYLADGKTICALAQESGMTIWSQPIPYQEADVKSVSANFVAVDIDQNLALYPTFRS